MLRDKLVNQRSSPKVSRATLKRCLIIGAFVFGGLIISACQSNAPSTNQTPVTAPTSIPFQVTSIDLSVHPASIAGMKCGTKLTVTYTATFHVPANTTGGTVQFAFTVNGGKTYEDGFLEFHPRGETSKQYEFSSSGALDPNGAFPGSGQVTVFSPVHLSSQKVLPKGPCTP